MKARIRSRWLALSTLAVGLLCQTGPCGLTEDMTRQVGQLVERTATNAVADTFFFMFDNFLVRLTG